MSVGLWWFYVTTCVVADLVPGPAVMLVLSNAIKYGPRRTTATILGILSANALYFAVSATSVGAMLLSSYNLFFLVKWVGAAYLIYLGMCALLSRTTALGTRSDVGPAQRSVAKLYMDGLVQLSNPKALLWFGAIVPQFLDPRQAVAPQILLLGTTGILLELPVLLGYAFVAGRITSLDPGYAKWTNRVAGCFLLSAGGGLAMMSRD